MKLFVGNLPYTVGHKAFREMFEEFGEVISAKVVIDDTKRSKGFGFVRFANEKDAQKAIKKLDNTETETGRMLEVSVAKSQD